MSLYHGDTKASLSREVVRLATGAQTTWVYEPDNPYSGKTPAGFSAPGGCSRFKYKKVKVLLERVFLGCFFFSPSVLDDLDATIFHHVESVSALYTDFTFVESCLMVNNSKNGLASRLGFQRPNAPVLALHRLPRLGVYCSPVLADDGVLLHGANRI